MPSRKSEILELSEICTSEEEILQSSDLSRLLKTYNSDISATIKTISDDPNEALKAYFQLRKFRGIISAPNSSALEFQDTLNRILVEKIIRQSENVKFNRDYLPFFAKNSRIFMNRGYLPITLNEESITRPIYPTDDPNSESNGQDYKYIELRKLPHGIKYTNFVTQPDPKEILAKADTPNGLGFTAENECSHAVFATVTYERNEGERIKDESIEWSEFATVPRGTIASDLLEQNRQYGAALFEGIGVERDLDGKINIFRLDEHAKRMSKGGQFFDMPAIPADIFRRMVIDCVQANKEFIPENGKGRLYIRPDWFDKGPRLHVNNSNLHALTMTAIVIGSMESYFKKGKKVFFVPQNVFRATTNGAGQTKAAGNYGATIRLQHRVNEAEMAGILYMDEGKDRIEETLASSFIRIIRRDGKIVLQTPKLDHGTILDSITRKTLLKVAKEELGWAVEEKDISPDQAFNSTEEILGYYAAGTAAGLAPIHGIRVGNFNNEKGEIEDLGEEIEIIKYDDKNPVGTEGQQLIDLLLSVKNGELVKKKIAQTEALPESDEKEGVKKLIAEYSSWLQVA